jgi:hypothetical protein
MLELGHLFLESDAAAWHEESAETPKMGKCRKIGVGASDYRDFELCELHKLRSICLPSSLPTPLCKTAMCCDRHEPHRGRLQAICSSQFEGLLVLIPMNLDTIACKTQTAISDLNKISILLRVLEQHCATYCRSDGTDTLIEVAHVDCLLLPWLFGLLETEEFVENILMGHHPGVTPLCTSFLATRLPLHLFSDLC